MNQYVVLATFSDRKLANTPNTNGIIDYFSPDVLSRTDYYAFGMLMPGRNDNADEYRFGITGMEKDNEIKGTGNSYDFGARMYDPRLGRWFSRDPLAKKYPSLSPYCYVGNTPTSAIDLDGRDIIVVGSKEYQRKVYGFLLQIMKDPKGMEILYEILSSEETLVIGHFNDGGSAVYGWPYSIGNGKTGRYMNLDFDDELPNGGKVGQPIPLPGWILAGHEIFHFYQDITNTDVNDLFQDHKKINWIYDDDYDVYDIENHGSGSEVGAVDFENRLRARAGIEPRHRYGGLEVYNKELSDPVYLEDPNGVKHRVVLLRDKTNPTNYDELANEKINIDLARHLQNEFMAQEPTRIPSQEEVGLRDITKGAMHIFGKRGMHVKPTDSAVKYHVEPKPMSVRTLE